MTRLAIALAALVVFSAGASLAQQCSLACDLDGDGATGTPADYGVFFASFGKAKGDPAYNAKADLDGDGSVTPSDWSLLTRFCPLGR